MEMNREKIKCKIIKNIHTSLRELLSTTSIILFLFGAFSCNIMKGGRYTSLLTVLLGLVYFFLQSKTKVAK